MDKKQSNHDARGTKSSDAHSGGKSTEPTGQSDESGRKPGGTEHRKAPHSTRK
jgi:hypothetical protein